MSHRRKIVYGLIGLAVAGFLVIQVLPMGNFVWWLQRIENPPVLQTILWDSPETEALVRTACFDCHSNETIWPWYSYAAPVSWLTLRDVNQGRAGLNFSEDGPETMNLDDMEWHITHDMPKRVYLVLHPEARYSDEQKAALIAGLRATFANASGAGMEDMDMGEGE